MEFLKGFYDDDGDKVILATTKPWFYKEIEASNGKKQAAGEKSWRKASEPREREPPHPGHGGVY